ncbi:hypothetical protein BASA81_006673 [Batrachochytrium salamandrivorans]|nr:hypothetical protein BASA81_006673 [Batrachochytrium salamandrivorans]
MVYGYLCDEGYLYARRERLVRLVCRTMKNEVDNTNDSGNRFAEEFDLMFLAITDILDFAACRYIDEKQYPVLILQEHNHARMHNVNKFKHIKRFNAFRLGFDLIFLRSGRTLGLALTCATEIGTLGFASALLGQTWLPNISSNAIAFHMLEEMEHSCVTASHLKPQVKWYTRLVATLVFAVLAWVFAFGCFFTRLLTHPKDLVDWKTYPELAVFLIIAVQMYVHFMGLVVLHFTPPGNFQGETPQMRNRAINLANDYCQRRGMEFDFAKPVIPRNRRLAPGSSLQKGELKRLVEKAKLAPKKKLEEQEGVSGVAVFFGVFFLVILLVEAFATLSPARA